MDIGFLDATPEERIVMIFAHQYKKMEEALKKLKLIEDESDIPSRDKSKKADFDEEEKDFIKQNMQNFDLSSSIHEASCLD